jgi:hypothetical protein
MIVSRRVPPNPKLSGGGVKEKTSESGIGKINPYSPAIRSNACSAVCDYATASTYLQQNFRLLARCYLAIPCS